MNARQRNTIAIAGCGLVLLAALASSAGFVPILAASVALAFYVANVPAWAGKVGSLRFLAVAMLCGEGVALAGSRLGDRALLDAGSAASWIIVAACVPSMLAWIKATRRPQDVLDLASPLKAGGYAVVQGGSQMLFNHHAKSPSQRFGVDIVARDGSGIGAEVYAPCSGRVVAMRDGLPDEGSLSVASESAFGNHIVIADERGTLIVLAHLLRDSVVVTVGSQVKTGQHVGALGNSGRSSEPHLHVHAEKEGKGVALSFNGRWLVRNSIL